MTTVDFKNTYWTYSGTCALFSKKERARLSGKLVSITSNVSHCLSLPKNPKFCLSSFQIEWVLIRLPTASLQSRIKYITNLNKKRSTLGTPAKQPQARQSVSSWGNPFCSWRWKKCSSAKDMWRKRVMNVWRYRSTNHWYFGQQFTTTWRIQFDVEISSLSSWVCDTKNRHLRHSLTKLLLVQHGCVVVRKYARHQGFTK